MFWKILIITNFVGSRQGKSIPYDPTAGAMRELEKEFGIDEDANEMFQFHGLPGKFADIVAASNVDPRLASIDGLYG